MSVVQAGDLVLRQRAEPLTPEEIAGAGKLIEHMWAVLHEVRGVGLAAPQVGVGKRLAIVHDLPEFTAEAPDDWLAERERAPIEPYVLINPELEPVGDETRTFYEGCLSVSGYAAAVTRHRGVRVRWLDERGEPHEAVRTGWHARILQHECDHLDGVLYVDRMDSRTLLAVDHHPVP